MKLISALVFSITFLDLPAANAQIIEEVDLSVIGTGIDSSSTSDKDQCFPPCRKGFYCHDGQCISKCNPPCPDGMDCRDDGDCHPHTTTIQKALKEISEISRVLISDELVQGAVIRTNRKNARVRIQDTIFEFDGALYLNIPIGEYDIHIDAPGYFENQEDLEVRIGTVEIIKAKLRPFQISFGISLGASTLKHFSLLAGDVNAGIGISSLIYSGFTGTYIGPVDVKRTPTTNYGIRYLPDTLKEVWTEFMGMGLSCGYLGINPSAHKIKFIPHIAIGYWEYDDQTYYLNKYSNGKTEYLDNLERHTVDKYFIRPALAIRIGEKVFNFNGMISAFIGTGIPVLSFMAGFEVDVPR